MTIPHQSKGSRSRDEVLAGEYVLGALGIEDRLNVQERMRNDRPFAAIVRRWEDNLLQFSDDYGSEVPPEMLFTRMDGRPWRPRRRRSMGMALAFWNSLAVWRGIGLAALGTLSLYLCLEAGADMRPGSEQSLVAGSSVRNGAIRLVAHYDGGSGRLQVTPAVAGGGKEKSLQVWMVKGTSEPHSLGVLPQTGENEVIVPPELRSRLADGATLALTVEPLGGVPVGATRGPMIALGPAHP